MKIRLVNILATSLFIALTVSTFSSKEPSNSPNAPSPHRTEDAQMRSIPDCSDLKGSDPVSTEKPCIINPNGVYRLVTSFSPFTETMIEPCGFEDGGPTLPCVWHRKNASTTEYNYFE